MNPTNRSRCRLCGGALALLGDLGSLRWLRCRNCGMDFCRKLRRSNAARRSR
jgi:hypothetical protein